MTSHSKETDRILDRFLKELGEPLPSTVRMRRASNRVLENLSGLETVVDPAAGIASLPGAQPKRRWAPVAAVAAALLAAAVLVGTLSLPGSAQPIAKRMNGKLIAPGDASSIGEGKLIRAEGSGNDVLGLRDGSQVEMGAGVELSINRAADGIQIDLAEGNIIVTAAKQHHGHLYVKTKDCMVSVVGTVFSVKAEATGSRVAVIEGEVHVQHGDVSQTLLPGQQVATSTDMKVVPLQTEVGWSKDPAVQVAMLQQATAPAAPPTPAPGTATIANPDLLGEIRLILAPVDQKIVNPDLVGEVRMILAPPGQGDAGGPAEKNKTLFAALQAQNPPVLTDDARAGVLRYFQNGATRPNSFAFTITGIQGRTISFSNSKNETFSYGCADCSFIVSETGVSKAASATEPGVEFKLSADGNTLTATCHATPCSMGRWVMGRSWTTQNGTNNAWGNAVFYTIGKMNPAASQTFTIPTSQLTSQQGGSVLFVVAKQAGQ